MFFVKIERKKNFKKRRFSKRKTRKIRALKGIEGVFYIKVVYFLIFIA